MPPRRLVKRGVVSAGPTSRKTQPETDQNDAVIEEENNEAVIENDDVLDKKENGDRETIPGYGKGERLDLDDNEHDYEPEEYCGLDYDEKESELEDVHDIVDEGQEECGEDYLQEEEYDMQEEELKDSEEEIEGEKGDEHELADAAEEDEHHEVVKERRKRKEFEVFVGGLDKDATEDDLRRVFSQVGEIAEIRLMMNPHTGKNKGFAFLRYASVEQAKRAVLELKNPVINGKKCGVTPSQDSDTLFVGNICKTWTKEALKAKLEHYGVGNLEDLIVVKDSNNEGMNRGFAFLEFPSRSYAMDAFKLLQKRSVVFGVDRPAKVSFAESFIDPGDEIMAQVKTVFVDGLALSWDEDHVRELLKKYGKVENIELARNMPYAKRRDYGFVTFDTHDAAVTCAKSIHNTDLGEGDNKAKVRARLSRPLHRSRGRHVGRGEFRPSRQPARADHSAWDRSSARSSDRHGVRGYRSRVPPSFEKRPVGRERDRRPLMSEPRGRPVASVSRSYERRPPPPPVSSYPKSSLKRDYGRHDELPPPRSRAVADYASRDVPGRRSTYRDGYPSRYSDLPRSSSRTSARRAYVDDEYARFERRPTSFHGMYAHDHDSVSGNKRPYSALDDVPPRYPDAGLRHHRARVEYDYGGHSAHYGDTYENRLLRSDVGYGGRSVPSSQNLHSGRSVPSSQNLHGGRSAPSSQNLHGGRSAPSSQNLHGPYGSREGMAYAGSYPGSDIDGLYTSSYGGDYMSRGSDVDGTSYSAAYSGRGLGGGDYMGMGGSGSYYNY